MLHGNCCGQQLKNKKLYFRFFIMYLGREMFRKTASIFGILILVNILAQNSFPAKADTARGTNFSVTKTGTPSTVSPQGTVNYIISIENIGQANAAPQIVRDTLPAGFSYIGNGKLTTVQNTQINFAPTVSGQVLTWTFDGTTLQTIPPTDNIIISYSVRATSTIGNFTNQACLVQPENVCANFTVTVANSPAAGIIQTGLLGIGGAASFLGIQQMRNRRRKQPLEYRSIVSA